jgi:hypothetical protein
MEVAPTGLVRLLSAGMRRRIIEFGHRQLHLETVMSLSLGRYPTPEEVHAIVLEARRARDQALAAALLHGLHRLVAGVRRLARSTDEQYLAQARDLRDLSRRIRLVEKAHGQPLLDPGR